MEHLEGRISILAALEARLRRMEVVLVSASAHPEKVADLIAAAERAGVPVKRVPADELDRMAHGRTHGGAVAVTGPRPPTPFDDLLRTLDAGGTPALLLILEGIDDGRNLGFVLRSAEALGAHGVLVKRHVWDYDGPEVSRASSGAYERFPIVRIDEVAGPVAALRKRGVGIWGCLAGAKRTLYDADLAKPVLLAVGGEKRGLSGALRELCDGFLSIPSQEGAASLSLSHAAAILLGEATRQRCNKGITG